MKKVLEFKKGTTRSGVLVYPLGVVLKFPRFDIYYALRVIIRFFIEGCVSIKTRKLFHVRHHTKWFVFGHYERPNSLFWFLFRGWFANINEARYFFTYPNNPLLIPTYFSLFGFINIQPIVVPMDYSDKAKNIYDKCYNATDIKNEMTGHDSHAWENGNFTEREDGTIALYDYGSSRAWPMVKKYGEQFSKILLTAQK